MELIDLLKNHDVYLRGMHDCEKVRFCKKCGEEIEYAKPDPCFGGYLKGIAYACCGHGGEKGAYCVGWEGCEPNSGSCDRQREDDPTYWELRGKLAIEYMEKLSENL